MISHQDHSDDIKAMKKSYKQIVASKYEFRTQVIINNNKGTIVFGEKKARDYLENKYNLKLSEPGVVTAHTKYQWRWRIPRNNHRSGM